MSYSEAVILNYGDGTQTTFCAAQVFCGSQSFTHTYSSVGTTTATLMTGTQVLASATVIVTAVPPATNLALNKSTGSSRQLVGFESSKAVDGNTTTYWNSGAAAPQRFQVDLGAGYSIGEVKLTVYQSVAGNSSYTVSGSSNGFTWTTLKTWSSASTSDGRILDNVFPTPPSNIRLIRVDITSSPSGAKVGLREVLVYKSSAIAAAPSTITHTLAKGWTGPEVSTLQRLLAKLDHFTAQFTGYFGPLTEQSVKSFQSENGLAAVGIVGPKTRALLNQKAL
jgi:hypothetical protein